MNRTVLRLALMILAVASLSTPCHACWWDDYDDWYCWYDDYDYYDSYDYNYDDYGYDDYNYDNYSYDYSYDDPYSSYDFENYDEIYDYENYEDSYDDININDEEDIYGPIAESDLYGELDNFDVDGDYFKSKDWQDFIKDFDSWTESNWYTEDNSDPPSNDTEPTDPSGTNEDGGGGGNDGGKNITEKNEDVVISSEPMGKYWLDPTRLCSVSELKNSINYYDNSNIIPNLPDKFREQGQNADCTARAIATAAWINTGDAAEYDYVMQMSYMVAKENDVRIAQNGVLSTEYMQMYSEYFDITEIKSGEFTSNDIKSCIDSGKSVMGTFCTGDVEYIIDPPVKHAHDVTIIAYSDDSYFCAYGEEDVLRVPKEAIDSHTIHILNGIKDSFIATNK